MQEGSTSSSAKPVLSVVVVIVSDTTGAKRDASHLALCLEALNRQVDPPPMEIVVPYKPPVDGIEELKLRFPGVAFIPVHGLKSYAGRGGNREHHDELRARGLEQVRGDIVALLEDHARPEQRWCASMVEEHSQRYKDFAAVGGAIENDVNRSLNWAVYFCDFGKYQNPVPEGASPFASDANTSYKRSAIESVKAVWAQTFHETAVNWALLSRGESLALSSRSIVFQHRTGLQLGDALRERFVWGRSYAATRSGLVGAKRSMYAALTPVLPGLLLLRMSGTAIKRRRHSGAFLKALPLTFLLTVSWSLGELAGYLTARAHSAKPTIALET